MSKNEDKKKKGKKKSGGQVCWAALVDVQWWIQGRGAQATPLFLDKTEA